MLGSSYGSTAPASINPATGKRYGPDFPEISMHDIVTAQRTLLRGLGVHRLVAVVGPSSYGGYQAFQWSVSYPDDMAGIAAVITAPRGSGKESDVQVLVDQFAKDPNWNGGWHYDRGGIPDTLTTLRIETLTRYGWNEILAEKFPTQAERDAEIRRRAEPWAKEFDPNSMVTMRRAAVRYNAEKDFSKIHAKVLYVISRSDKLFPPSIAPDVMDKLAKAGVDAKYFEIDTAFGHSATGVEWAKRVLMLKAFVEGSSQKRERSPAARPCRVVAIESHGRARVSVCRPSRGAAGPTANRPQQRPFGRGCYRGGAQTRHRTDMHGARCVTGDLLQTAAAPERRAVQETFAACAYPDRTHRSPRRAPRTEIRGSRPGRGLCDPAR